MVCLGHVVVGLGVYPVEHKVDCCGLAIPTVSWDLSILVVDAPNQD